MRVDAQALERRLFELRRAFDEAFARPSTATARDLVQFALVRVRGRRYAIRVLELAGFEVNRQVVPVPAQLPGLLGLSAVRGQLVPVFDLGALVGLGAASEWPRWLALCRPSELIGLAFDAYEGTRGVPAPEVHGADAMERSEASRQVIRVDGELVPVLELSSVVPPVDAAL